MPRRFARGCAKEARVHPDRNIITSGRGFEPHYEVLRAQVAGQANATIAELRAWMARQHGFTVSRPVMWETLRRLKLTLKNVLPAASAGVISHGVLVCSNVSGHRA